MSDQGIVRCIEHAYAARDCWGKSVFLNNLFQIKGASSTPQRQVAALKQIIKLGFADLTGLAEGGYLIDDSNGAPRGAVPRWRRYG